MTAVMCAVGATEGVQVEVGLHQGLALNPLLLSGAMGEKGAATDSFTRR